MRRYFTALLASKTPGGDVETPLSELEHMLTQHMVVQVDIRLTLR